ncbi:MAG: glycosyltransferase family 4 protein [Chthoniobacterales bacterium]
MKSLRIAIIIPTFLPKCSGAEVFHHNLAVRLVAAGHRTTVIVPKGRARQLRRAGWSLPYAVESYPDKRWNFLKRNSRFGFWLTRRALFALQKRYRFDVWHSVVLYPTSVCLADWQARSGVPTVIRPVGDDVGGLPSRRHTKHVDRVLREKLPLAKAVVALSADMRDELIGLGIAPEKIRIIPNAVETGLFTGAFRGRSAVRVEMGIPDDAFVFLCVARNHPQKDFPTLFAAFAQLCAAHPGHDLRLVVAGRDALTAKVDCGEFSNRVHLAEFGAKPADGVPSMPPEGLVEVYRSADAFVLSSLLEGFSSALIEAMAAGLPSVLTDVPGIRGVVVDGREGLLVPCGKPAALADAMGRLVNNVELREQLARAARCTAATFDWSSVVAAYLLFYESAIAGKN